MRRFTHSREKTFASRVVVVLGVLGSITHTPLPFERALRSENFPSSTSSPSSLPPTTSVETGL